MTELCKEVTKQINEQNFDVSKLPSINNLSPAMRDAMEWFFNAEETSMIIYDDDNGEKNPWIELNMSKEEYKKQIMADIEKYNLFDHLTDVTDNDYKVFLGFEGSLLSSFSKPMN